MSPPAASPSIAQPEHDPSAWNANRRLARSVNVIDMASSRSGEARGATVTDAQAGQCIAAIGQCAAAGFTAVRLPVNFAADADAAAPYRVDPAVLDRVARAVDHATGLGLAIVVCNFQYPELMADPAAHRDRHLGIVDQISSRFRHAPDTVYLEPLAEPHDRLDPLWNAYLADTLTVARAQHATRPILAGPGFFNTVRALPALQLPASDRHLIVTLHHYWPLEFTFQGETWFTGSDTRAWLGTTWQPTPDRTAVLDAGFAQIAEWSARHDRPVFLGEFGTTSHADMPSRAAWTRYNRALAEHHGFSWCYWSYGPSFALRDAEHHDWQPQLIDALIPAADRQPPADRVPATDPAQSAPR